jgi:uncharacterized phage protein (TIGR02220 family)
LPRIRTIKPEFWEDEDIGCLSRDARLLFIATWNLADDEGLLRWTSAYLKSSVFMYDDDVGLKGIESMMAELEGCGSVFSYLGGRKQQRLAYIVKFRRHQRINRPQGGRLPPPSLQSADVKNMFGRRDGMVCGLCGHGIYTSAPTGSDQNFGLLSLDHITPRAAGGHDYPSNIRATHVSCNKSRRDRPDEDFNTPESLKRWLELGEPESFSDGTLIHSVNESVTEQGSGNRDQGVEQGKAALPRQDILALFKEITGRGFRSLPDSAAARFKEGATIDELRLVLEWLWRERAGGDLEKYIRPSTVFQPSKWSEYLAEAESCVARPMAITYTQCGAPTETGDHWIDENDEKHPVKKGCRRRILHEGGCSLEADNG